MNHEPATTTPSIVAQKKYWDTRWLGQSEPNRWQTHRSNRILAIARRLPLQRPRILDLGCGTGFTTLALSELGEAQGVDLSPAAIGIAIASYPGIHFRAADLYDLDFDSGTFDLIVCQEVIPHVSDQSRLVELIAAWTRTRGFLILTAANKFVMDRMTGGDGGPVGSGPTDPAAHIKQWLSTREIRKLLSKRFEILETTSAIAVGNRGILRLINSPKLNKAVGHVISFDRLDNIKGRLGWGYTIFVVGRKRQ